MFKCLKYDHISKYYTLVDDDFECELFYKHHDNCSDKLNWIKFYSSFIDLYTKKGLNVGQNMAYYIQWKCFMIDKAKELIKLNDQICGDLPGWSEYAKERDNAFKLIMVWK